jgi:hypothetical protein
MDNDIRIEEKRKNALELIEQLLRVTSAYESKKWVKHYTKIKIALKEKNYQKVIKIHHECKSSMRFTAKWKTSYEMAEVADTDIRRLRVYVEYGIERDSVPLFPTDPVIDKKISERRIRPFFQKLISQIKCFIFLPSPKACLIRKINLLNIEEAFKLESQELHGKLIDSDEKVVYKPKSWDSFIQKMMPGDELWFYRFPDEYWMNLMGQQGYVILRDGKLINTLMTVRN